MKIAIVQAGLMVSALAAIAADAWAFSRGIMSDALDLAALSLVGASSVGALILGLYGVWKEARGI